MKKRLWVASRYGRGYGNRRPKAAFRGEFMATRFASSPVRSRDSLLGYRGVVETNRGCVGASVDQPLTHAKLSITGDTCRFITPIRSTTS
jgi:hypothetical protein